MNAGFQQQQPLAFTAAVRSTPSPQQAAHLRLDSAPRAAVEPPVRPEEKRFAKRPKR
jgi:hypothetical protein